MTTPPRIIVPPPRPTQGTKAAKAAIERAQNLACMIRDESADSIGAYLDALTTNQMYALVTTLAAMVPVDRSADELLDWLEPTLAVVA